MQRGSIVSLRLEQNGVYLLPNGLQGDTYMIVEAREQGDGWQLVECHATPLGHDTFKQRATLPQQQQYVYHVEADGTLVEHAPTQQPTRFSLVNLSLLGRLIDNTFVPIESQQAQPQP